MLEVFLVGIRLSKITKHNISSVHYYLIDNDLEILFQEAALCNKEPFPFFINL